jgi:hypothetical protein
MCAECACESEASCFGFMPTTTTTHRLPTLWPLSAFGRPSCRPPGRGPKQRRGPRGGGKPRGRGRRRTRRGCAAPRARNTPGTLAQSDQGEEEEKGAHTSHTRAHPHITHARQVSQEHMRCVPEVWRGACRRRRTGACPRAAAAANHRAAWLWSSADPLRASNRAKCTHARSSSP